MNHASIKEACSWLRGSNPPKHLDATVSRLRMNAALSDVSAAFLALQEGREGADYDHDFDITRASALGLVRRADSAARSVEAASETDDFRALYGLISLKTSIRG